MREMFYLSRKFFLLNKNGFRQICKRFNLMDLQISIIRLRVQHDGLAAYHALHKFA